MSQSKFVQTLLKKPPVAPVASYTKNLEALSQRQAQQSALEKTIVGETVSYCTGMIKALKESYENTNNGREKLALFEARQTLEEAFLDKLPRGKGPEAHTMQSLFGGKEPITKVINEHIASNPNITNIIQSATFGAKLDNIQSSIELYNELGGGRSGQSL